MLLRSSSTPVLGSLLVSISDSPNHHHHHHHHQPEVPHTASKHPSTTIPHSRNSVSFHQAGSQNLTTFSCYSSTNSSIAEFGTGHCSHTGFRKARSEANLVSLANATSNNDEFGISNLPTKFSRRPNCSLLETIPSFLFHGSTGSYEDEDSEEKVEEYEEGGEELENNGSFSKNVFGGEERVDVAKPNDFKMEKNNHTALNEEMRDVNAYGTVRFEKEMGGFGPHMYLARGLGLLDIDFVSGGGPYGGGGTIGRGSGGGGDDGDGNNLEAHYKRMVEGNPGNPLRNYAQFLYQSKQEVQGAEEYYSRSILADPNDGEILSQYAKLVWELHRDEDRTTSYFKRAVQAAPEDSHVHAAYASFLWQIEEDEDDTDALNCPHVLQPLLHRGPIASSNA